MGVGSERGSEFHIRGELLAITGGESTENKMFLPSTDYSLDDPFKTPSKWI